MHNNLPFKSSFITMAGPRGQNPSMVLPSRNCPPFLNCQSLALTSCATVYPNTQSMALSTCNIQTTVYPNTQPMALSTDNIQTTVYPNTVHGFVILQHLDHSVPKHKAQPATFRPQCTQTHSPWLCQPATFRPVYPNTQPMALSACNIQTGVPKHTVHGFVSLQHSDRCTQTHSPWLCQPATFRPVYPNTQSMALSACNIQTGVPKHSPWLCQPATFRPQCNQTVLFLVILYHRVQFQCAHMHAYMYVCMCVGECACARKRQRERESEWEWEYYIFFFLFWFCVILFMQKCFLISKVQAN